MAVLSDIQEPVKNEMQKFEPVFREYMKSKVPLLNIITNYILRRKGKQMRPLFVFLCAKLNGEISDSTFSAASLIELMHTATLVHDDVVDEAYERRGFFSINALWKSKAAVLVGDFFLARGLTLSIAKKEFRLLEILSVAIGEMSEGELLQMQKARSMDITEEIYFDIIRKKTATLLAACAASGTASVKANDETVEKMRLFGEYVGIAFQIKDDLFDYQNSGSIGKPVGNDIRQKKITLPLIYALNNATSANRNTMISILKKHNQKNSAIKQLIEMVKQHNGLKYAIEKMEEYKNKALSILENYPNSDTKNSLIKLVEYTTSRKN